MPTRPRHSRLRARIVFIGFHPMAAMEHGRTVGAAYVDGEHDGNGYRAAQPDLRGKKMIHVDRANRKSMFSLSFELS